MSALARDPTSTRADLEERKERNIEALCIMLGIPYPPKPGDGRRLSAAESVRLEAESA
jgi:hypothetical protein